MAKPGDLILDAKMTSRSLELEEEIACVQYTEDFDYILVGYDNGVIKALHNFTPKFNLTDDTITKAKAAVTAMKHRPTSKNYPITNVVTCTYGNGLVKGWNYNFKECTFTLEEKRRTNGLFYHKTLPKFVTFGDDKKIYIYDEDSKRRERILSSSGDDKVLDGHRGSVTAACFHPKQVNELVTGGLDNNIFIWDTRQAHAVRHIAGVTMNGPGIDFQPGRNEFVTCSGQKEKPIRIWDYGSGKEVPITDDHVHRNVPLNFGYFGSKSHIICGGTDPNIIRIIRAEKPAFQTFSLISNIPKSPTWVSLGGDVGAAVPKFAFGSLKKLYEISFK